MVVEPVHARGLVDETLRDRSCLGRPLGEAPGDLEHFGIEATRWEDGVDEAVSSARAASSLGFSSTSSMARRNPSRRGRKNVELSAPVSPVLPYAHSKQARSEA